MSVMNVVDASLIGREAAIYATAFRPSLRDVEALARSRNYSVSRAALSRAMNNAYNEPHRPNDAIIAQASHDFAEDLSAEYECAFDDEDIKNIRAWFKLNHHDYILNQAPHDDPFWATDYNFVSKILDEAPREHPFNKVLRASAFLHVCRNPMIEEDERRSAREHAVNLLETAVKDAETEYFSIELPDLLEGDWKSLPETGPVGLLLSITLNLLNVAYGAAEYATWLRYITSLKEQGLLPHLAVRGVFFSDPTTLSNTAELYWVLDDNANAEALLRHAEILDANLAMWIKEVASKYYEPDFVAFALNILSQTDAVKE